MIGPSFTSELEAAGLMGASFYFQQMVPLK